MKDFSGFYDKNQDIVRNILFLESVDEFLDFSNQDGYIQSYRSESHARKMIPFFEGAYPEYMVCRDVDKFISILQYFLEKDRKPGKRQNVKWTVVERES